MNPTRKMKKDFSLIKWFIFPLLVLIGAVSLAYCSTEIFGFEGSFPYYLVLGGIFIISFILILHCGNDENRPAQIAAFAFESIGIIVLIVVCGIAIAAMREISSIRKVQGSNNQSIEAISKLKSRSAQATLAKTAVAPVNEAEVIAKIETRLNYGFAFECGVYFIGLFTVYGLVLFWKPKAAYDPNYQQRELQPLPLFGEPSYLEHIEPNRAAYVRVKRNQAALQLVEERYKTVSNGKNAFRFRSAKGSTDRVQISYRVGRNKEKFCATVTPKEADKLSTLEYDELREEILKLNPKLKGEI